MVAFNDYHPRDGGFRVVWVRPDEQGVQLRFLFGKPTPRHAVKIAGGQVKVTLRTAE